MSGRTVTVELTKKELQVLRRLVIDEYTRLRLFTYQRESEWPSKAKRMRSVAKKIWAARRAIDGDR